MGGDWKLQEQAWWMMGKETFGDKVRSIIAGIGWRVFLWGIKMSEDEYITAIAQEGIRGYLEAQAGDNARYYGQADAV
jgi:hypothetical protein